MPLKTGGSEKVPYSKVPDIKVLVSLWAMVNTKEKTLRASLCVAVVEDT